MKMVIMAILMISDDYYERDDKRDDDNDDHDTGSRLSMVMIINVHYIRLNMCVY